MRASCQISKCGVILSNYNQIRLALFPVCLSLPRLAICWFSRSYNGLLYRSRLFCYNRTSPLLSRHGISRSRHIHSAPMVRCCWHRGCTQRTCIKQTRDRLYILFAGRYSCHYRIEARPNIEARFKRPSWERSWTARTA